MAKFEIEVPDDQVQLIGEAFAQQFSMEPPVTVTGEGEDETRTPVTGQALVDAQVEFARQKVVEIIQLRVRDYLVWQHQQKQPEITDTPLNLT